METVSNNIIGYLLLHNQTAEQFANVVGVTPETLSAWVMLRRSPRNKDVARMALLLGEFPFVFTSARFGYFGRAVQRLIDARGDVASAGFGRSSKHWVQMLLKRAGGTNFASGKVVGPWIPLVRFGGAGDSGEGIPEPVGMTPVPLPTELEHPRSLVVEATDHRDDNQVSLLVDARHCPLWHKPCTVLARLDGRATLLHIEQRGKIVRVLGGRYGLADGGSVEEGKLLKHEELEMLGVCSQVMGRQA